MNVILYEVNIRVLATLLTLAGALRHPCPEIYALLRQITECVLVLREL